MPGASRRASGMVEVLACGALLADNRALALQPPDTI